MARNRHVFRAVGVLVILLGAAVLPPVQKSSASPSAAGSSGYRFYAKQASGGQPVRWNPCSPITYRINTNGVAGRAAVRRVRAAVSEAAAASGIRFRYVGRTRFVPDSRTAPVPRAVGADVVIAWAREGRGARRSALLPIEARLAGVGGFGTAKGAAGYRVARTGFVVFNSGHIFAMSPAKQYVVALHELGHLLGLDHVANRREIMLDHVLGRGPKHYGPGDRAGLRRLGRGAGCLVPTKAPSMPKASRVAGLVRVATSAVASVSGPVTYTLSSPELGGIVASSRTPRFDVPLRRLVQAGRALKNVRFAVSATNWVGTSTSRAAPFAVPAVVVTRPPRVVVTPTSFRIVGPTAVFAGTTVDVSDLVTSKAFGTVTAVEKRGRTWSSGLAKSITFLGNSLWVSFQVSGGLLVTGISPQQSFDLSGTYLTGQEPDPVPTVPVPADPEPTPTEPTPTEPVPSDPTPSDPDPNDPGVSG